MPVTVDTVVADVTIAVDTPAAYTADNAAPATDVSTLLAVIRNITQLITMSLSQANMTVDNA